MTGVRRFAASSCTEHHFERFRYLIVCFAALIGNHRPCITILEPKQPAAVTATKSPWGTRKSEAQTVSCCQLIDRVRGLELQAI